MKIIAGLGNPGAEYARTKHNVGFMLVDALAERLGVDAWREKFNALTAEGRIGAQKVLLVKPLTYMNESGRAVGPLLDWYKLAPEDLIVAHDDMDIAAGTIRLRRKGSAGGHNGLKSIISNLGSGDFVRIRVGVGSKPAGWDLADYVLGRAKGEDAEKMEEAYADAVEAVLTVLESGVDKAMNEVNRREKNG